MTDLTILIAVIALALWPLAFLVLRIRHERKKRRDRLDRMTKEDLEDIGTEELVIAVLKKIGCQPETNAITAIRMVRSVISVCDLRVQHQNTDSCYTMLNKYSNYNLKNIYFHRFISSVSLSKANARILCLQKSSAR